MDHINVPKTIWLVVAGHLQCLKGVVKVHCHMTLDSVLHLENYVFIVVSQNHFQQRCRSKKNVNYMNPNLSMDNNDVDRYDDDNDNLCVFSLASDSNEMHRDKWNVNLSIYGNDYDFMIDTLGQSTVIPYHIYTHFHNKLPMHTSTITINGFGGSIVKPIGYIIITSSYIRNCHTVSVVKLYQTTLHNLIF